MDRLRSYGDPPFTIAVVHGGPGATGEMAPVARELALNWGVLEPLQSAGSVEGQVEELKHVLKSCGHIPLTLVGHSWGAWLSFILAARYPECVRKLILVASPPFTADYADAVQATRLSRLSALKQVEFEAIQRRLEEPDAEGMAALLSQLGRLASKTDQYHPASEEPEAAHSGSLDGVVFTGVWKEASELRRSGRLLALGKQIICPVTAIHGDYDPHPAEGVRAPLGSSVSRFRFTLLENCGHTPWMEEEARRRFYEVLREEIQDEKLGADPG